jgi:hypothetical protein
MSTEEVVLNKVPAMTVASVREVIPTYEDIGEHYEEIFAYLGQHGVSTAGAPLTLYHDKEHRERDIDAESAVPVAGSVPMFRYATGALLAFGWDGHNLIPQMEHILMTLAVVYVLVNVVRNRAWRRLALGLALGVAILIPLVVAQTWWFQAHPEMLEMLFSGDWGFPGQ